MKFIDLHVHSTASDGSFSPAEVAAAAEEKGLSAIALTDHDTTDGVDEALAAAENMEVEVIPGIEISCVYEGKEIHILGLCLDHKNKELLDFLKTTRQKRDSRNTEMLRAFQDGGFPLTWDDLFDGVPGTVVTRAHFARALLKKGCVSSVDQAFKKYLSPGCPYYRKKEDVTPKQAMEILRTARAFPALAHPCQYKFGWEKTEELIVYLKSLGMLGLECFHSSNNQAESARLRALADRHGLCVTGGSDFHGAAKPDISIGTGRGNLRVPAFYLDAIRLASFLTGL